VHRPVIASLAGLALLSLATIASAPACRLARPAACTTQGEPGPTVLRVAFPEAGASVVAVDVRKSLEFHRRRNGWNADLTAGIGRLMSLSVAAAQLRPQAREIIVVASGGGAAAPVQVTYEPHRAAFHVSVLSTGSSRRARGDTIPQPTRAIGVNGRLTLTYDGAPRTYGIALDRRELGSEFAFLVDSAFAVPAALIGGERLEGGAVTSSGMVMVALAQDATARHKERAQAAVQRFGGLREHIRRGEGAREWLTYFTPARPDTVQASRW